MLGLTAGTTTATNLLSQNAVAQGQVLNIQIGTNPPNAPLVVTFGNLAGQVETMAQLSAKLGTLNPLLGAASVNVANGNISISAASMTDDISFPGSTAIPKNFGIQVPLAMPSSQQVVGADVPVFLTQSLSGGSITAYDPSGAPVNLQLRWAKTNGVPEGGTDTWNLFYQSNHCRRLDAGLAECGHEFHVGANGQMNPPISNLNLANVTVNGVSLGNILLSFTGAVSLNWPIPTATSWSISCSRTAPSGTLQSISVSNQGRIDGLLFQRRTIDLAVVSLASFTGETR